MERLNLGCGKDIRQGYVNLDSIKLPGVDIVHELNRYPWPFKKNKFDYVYCDNVLEHLNEVLRPMEEIWRISKNGGVIDIIVPIYPSVWSFSDPTHHSAYTYFTFNYFQPEDSHNYYTKARFTILKRKVIFNRFVRPLEWIFNCCELFQKIWALYFYYLFPAEFLKVRLKVLK